MTEPLWIFGYGSLVWRPSFDFEERRAGVVRGWRRRFWQGSTDHRGVPGAPGRVVTVLPEPEAACHGVVYSVAQSARDEVLAHLDYREKGGYERHEVDVATAGGVIAEALMYVAAPDNPNYVGPKPLDDIAEQVRRSVGPSGPNLEYVLRLAEALREMNADDEHVFALEALLRR